MSIRRNGSARLPIAVYTLVTLAGVLIQAWLGVQYFTREGAADVALAGMVSWAMVLGVCAGEVIRWTAWRVTSRGRERAERARNTGTWTCDEDWVTVRWDPGGRRYWVRNADSGTEQIQERLAYLTGYLGRLEELGFVPADDEGTQAVRGLLRIDPGKPMPY